MLRDVNARKHWSKDSERLSLSSCKISVNGTITHLSHVQMEKLESLPPDQKTPKSE
jgi:hypothetical protein